MSFGKLSWHHLQLTPQFRVFGKFFDLQNRTDGRTDGETTFSRMTLSPTTHHFQHGKIKQHTLNNVNNCLNTNIYSYLETSGGQSSNPYLNVVHIFGLIRNLWQLKTAVFLHWCLIRAVPMKVGN